MLTLFTYSLGVDTATACLWREAGEQLWESGLFTKWLLRTEFRGSGLTGVPLSTEPPYWLAVLAFFDVVLPSPSHFFTYFEMLV